MVRRPDAATHTNLWNMLLFVVFIIALIIAMPRVAFVMLGLAVLWFAVAILLGSLFAVYLSAGWGGVIAAVVIMFAIGTEKPRTTSD